MSLFLCVAMRCSTRARPSQSRYRAQFQRYLLARARNNIDAHKTPIFLSALTKSTTKQNYPSNIKNSPINTTTTEAVKTQMTQIVTQRLKNLPTGTTTAEAVLHPYS
jgi:hypothetical protein